MADISVIGAGSWGTAISKVLSDNGNHVTIWSAVASEVDMINKMHEHQTKLPGVVLDDSVIAVTDMQKACEEKDLLVFVVPSIYVRETAKKAAPYIKKGQKIVNLAKGIESETLYTLCEVISEEIPEADVCVLLGPSHAEEVGKRIPTTLVAGASTSQTAKYIQNIFMNDVLRVYTSPDIIGIELGGALKNIIALAAGTIDGLGYGDNTKAALMTRGITEMTRLGVACGGNAETFSGLSGIGDLIVTCTSKHSRNRNAGYLIGKGYSMEEAMKAVKMVVEGVYSAKAALALANKHNVSMPIVSEVNAVLFNHKSPKDAVADLFSREKKTEHQDLSW